MHLGMALQVIALGLLTAPDAWLSIPYVMMAQALSGIAKDLNKMSAKASVKTILASTTDSQSDARLFKWVAVLTGSKNAMKGIGFFLGAALLELASFREALLMLACGLLIVLISTFILLPRALGKSKSKAKFTQVFSNNAAINWLSAARFFLFGARDVWFVVAVPVFMVSILQWSYTQVGSFMALWVIGYGIIQASTPRLLRIKQHTPTSKSAQFWVFVLLLVTAGLAIALEQDRNLEITLVAGLLLFGIIFAINSALHSYLILAYADHDKVAMKVGFYYMANAGGRLAGTVLSGYGYQQFGLVGCLWLSAGFVFLSFLLSLFLPTDLSNTHSKR